MKKFIYIFMLVITFLITGMPAVPMPPHPDLLKKWEDEGTAEMNMKRLSVVQDNMTGKSMNKASSIGNGTIYIPVLLVKYSGSSFAGASTSAFYSNMLNDAALSVKKYYNDMSNGNLTIVFDVYSLTDTVAQSAAYYGNNVSGAGSDEHPGQLVNEAVEILKTEKDSSVDFSKYDNDNNGYVDCIILIHTGRGEEVSDTDAEIWSHQWDLYSAGLSGDGDGMVTADGVKFNVYTIQPEYVDAAGDSTIGVFCHELGHVFGLPDLYDYTGDTNGVGNWSLMSGGSYGSDTKGTNPAPILAWERYRIGGSAWVSYTDIYPAPGFNDKNRSEPFYMLLLAVSVLLSVLFSMQKKAYHRGAAVPVSVFLLIAVFSCTVKESETVINGSIDNIEVSHKAYRIPLGAGQYLFLEGKTAQTTTAGWYVPGTGVLVTHVHEGIVSKYINAGKVNDSETRVHGVNVVEAKTSAQPGKLWTLGSYYGSADDLFCLENNDSLTISTFPDTMYYKTESITSKTGDSGVSITSFTTNTSWPITFHAEY